jgi:hypothetical protein
MRPSVAGKHQPKRVERQSGRPLYGKFNHLIYSRVPEISRKIFPTLLPLKHLYCSVANARPYPKTLLPGIV